MKCGDLTPRHLVWTEEETSKQKSKYCHVVFSTTCVNFFPVPSQVCVNFFPVPSQVLILL